MFFVKTLQRSLPPAAESRRGERTGQFLAEEPLQFSPWG